MTTGVELDKAGASPKNRTVSPEQTAAVNLGSNKLQAYLFSDEPANRVAASFTP